MMPEFLKKALDERREVKLITINGYQMYGYIVDVDPNFGSVTLMVDGKERFIFMSAISTIV